MLNKVAIQKIVLDLTADQEYIYEPEIGFLKAYEKHFAQFGQHLPDGLREEVESLTKRLQAAKKNQA